jgi:hypothetical protein
MAELPQGRRYAASLKYDTLANLEREDTRMGGQQKLCLCFNGRPPSDAEACHEARPREASANSEDDVEGARVASMEKLSMSATLREIAAGRFSAGAGASAGMRAPYPRRREIT